MSYDGYDEDDLEFDNDSDDPRDVYDNDDEDDWDDDDYNRFEIINE